MNGIQKVFAAFFMRSTGWTYTNLARLFMRLFVGIMLLQFGVRHLVNFNELAPIFPAVLGLSSKASLVITVVIEVGCSVMIMLGCLTRLMSLPPLLLMIVAACLTRHQVVSNLPLYGLDNVDPGYLPIMFTGIYIYLLIAGPGKISFDYLISIYFLSLEEKSEEEVLEDV